MPKQELHCPLESLVCEAQKGREIFNRVLWAIYAHNVRVAELFVSFPIRVMNARKFCLAIASSLGLYVLLSILLKTNYIPLSGARNLFNTRFTHDAGIINNNDTGIKSDAQTNACKQYARVSQRQLSQLQEPATNTKNRVKYNTSLSPRWYAIDRPAESTSPLSSDLDRKTIAQLEADASMANKLGEASKHFPTTLIIGVRKAGTRALLAILKLHPQVKSCGPEVHYFDQRYPRGLQWYLDQTPDVRAGQQTIEKTPSYFVVKGVPQRVLEYSKAINKTLKLIVIFRDPTVRAISDYVQLRVGVRTKYNTGLKPFEKMAIKNSSAFQINTSWNVIKTGVYSKHLQRWLRYFPSKWFHYVSGEEMVRNPVREIKRVEKFLDLTPFFSESNFVFNAEKGFPCFRSAANKNERCLGKAKGRTHPTVDPSVLSELRRYYRPFNEQLYNITQRNFGWPPS